MAYFSGSIQCILRKVNHITGSLSYGLEVCPANCCKRKYLLCQIYVENQSSIKEIIVFGTKLNGFKKPDGYQQGQVLLVIL